MALLVNGDLISDDALREERRLIRRLLGEQLPHEAPSVLEQRSKEWAAENLIERELLKQAARAKQQTVEALVAGLTSPVARPRHKDIVEYYKKNRENFVAEEAVHAAHIVKNVDEKTTDEEARAAIAQVSASLRDGVPFEKLADENSDCPGRGGDLGYFARGQMVDEFEQVAFALQPGETSDAFRSPFGYHVVKVYAKRPAGVQPLEAVSKDIEESLFDAKKRKVLEQYVDALRAKAKVEEAAPVR